MAVTLTLRCPVDVPVEVEGVLPERLLGASLDDVLAMPVSQGNARTTLGEFFSAVGTCDDDATLIFEGDLHAVKAIGRGMTAGQIIVRGPAGMHLGAEMSGGVIEVHGDVGDWAGAEMRGGAIHVYGAAGDCLGGAYRGSRRGMQGGEILVDGDAGHEIGRVMRRGLIAVGGRCGEFAGSRMIAGTILVLGPAGRRAGAGMKRGTIGLLAAVKTELLPTFHEAGEFRANFLDAYFQRLRVAEVPGAEGLVSGPLERWCGDSLALGLGEILRPVS